MKTFASAHFAVETPPGEVELDASTYFTNKAYTVSEADTDMAEPVEVLAMRPDEAAEKWAAICDYEAGGAPIAVEGLKVLVKVVLGNDVWVYEITGSCDCAYDYSAEAVYE